MLTLRLNFNVPNSLSAVSLKSSLPTSCSLNLFVTLSQYRPPTTVSTYRVGDSRLDFRLRAVEKQKQQETRGLAKPETTRARLRSE